MKKRKERKEMKHRLIDKMKETSILLSICSQREEKWSYIRDLQFLKHVYKKYMEYGNV